MTIRHVFNRTLMHRALLQVAAVMLAVIAAAAFAFGGMAISQAEQGLREKAGQATDLASLAVVEPLWTLDTAQLQAVLRRLATDPDFVAAAISDEAGKEVARQDAAGVADVAGRIAVRKELVREGRRLGTLELALSPERSRAAARHGDLAGRTGVA
jgi:uncharacterized membrane protein affecting hemolysin expression